MPALGSTYGYDASPRPPCMGTMPALGSPALDSTYGYDASPRPPPCMGTMPAQHVLVKIPAKAPR